MSYFKKNSFALCINCDCLLLCPKDTDNIYCGHCNTVVSKDDFNEDLKNKTQIAVSDNLSKFIRNNMDLSNNEQKSGKILFSPPIKKIKKINDNSLTNIINNYESENKIIKEELEFYKSIFKSHPNSLVSQVKIKTLKGKKVWIDRIRDDKKYISSLDMDDEISEWLKPIKAER